MKNALLAIFLCLAALPALAQTRTPPGQVAGGMNQSTFDTNTPSVGFGENNLNPAVIAAGTTQATATVLTAKFNLVTTCASGAGVQLPSLVRFSTILVINRSGGACLVYPSPGATAESAPGTAAAVNAGVSIASNASITFRPVSAAAWLQ